MARALAALLLIGCSWPAAAAAQRADVLTGRVTTEDGEPVVGARIQVTSAATQLTQTRLTGADGRYLVYFPDGGGSYVLRASYIGMMDAVQPVVRIGSEELLLTNVVLRPQAITLDELLIAVQRAREGGAGDATVVLSQELLSGLPLADLEPGTLAALAGGVIAIERDEDGRLGFSVGGMREELNQVTVDGVSAGDEPFGVPREGVRRVDVTTSTSDVSRGGFAGGQVAVSSARGTNQSQGSLTYEFDDSSLQLRASPAANAFTRHDFGGSYGGPILQNTFFYNVSFQIQQNTNHRYALAANDPLAARRSGVDVDSIARFLSILERFNALPDRDQTGAYGQATGDLRVQTRLDWNITQKNERSHTLSARFNANLNRQDSTRISALDITQHGGEAGRNQRQAVLNVTSRIGSDWTNALDLSHQENRTETVPYIEMPEGQVRVTSVFADGTRGSSTLYFGGNRAMPTEVWSRDLRVSNELSIVRPLLHGQVHRIKVGGSLERNESMNRSAENRLGLFRFASLADFEANQPSRYERTLTERETRSGRIAGAVYFGDTWRLTEPLEVTLGLRWDYAGLAERPAYNPAVDAAFNRRTDIVARAAAWSPRVGFNLNLPGRGRQRPSLSGGLGYYAGRAPQNIYATAIRQTGLPDSEVVLVCIGEAVPAPDWGLYRIDPSAVPSVCEDGGGASPGSSRAPTVTVIEPRQSLPGSIRLDLGYRRPLPLNLSGNFRYQYSLGRGLWGYRDINLDTSRSTTLGPDPRLFFGDPATISQRTGTVSSVSSRRFREFAQVLEVTSDLRSVSHQFTAQLQGTLPPRIRTNLTYTLGFARDQGSGSFASVTTAGNPNQREWGTANNDRRHNLNVQLTYAFTEYLEVSTNSRLQSGLPFTPLVSRDVNGDGMRNDRAFVFDPNATADTALAAGMVRLLRNLPGRVRDCLTAQLGAVASRNSCRNGWTQALDMRANFRPRLPSLDRRLTISADVKNVPTGLDFLINGRDRLKGWGEGQRSDANLLDVLGFDAGTGTFRYEVNESFGQDNRGPNAARNAFSLMISARLVLGSNPNQTRPFNTAGPGQGQSR